MIKEAEEAKARIYEVSGNKNNHWSNFAPWLNLSAIPKVQSSIVDEDYRLVAAHVKESIKMNILNHEYVDFAKLLPGRDRSLGEDEQVMRLINKGGQAFYAPVEHGTAISNYNKWEQAFRVFRWFKFTLKPPYSGASERSLSAIWDTSHWNFFVKFGLRTA